MSRFSSTSHPQQRFVFGPGSLASRPNELEALAFAESADSGHAGAGHAGDGDHAPLGSPSAPAALAIRNANAQAAEALYALARWYFPLE